MWMNLIFLKQWRHSVFPLSGLLETGFTVVFLVSSSFSVWLSRRCPNPSLYLCYCSTFEIISHGYVGRTKQLYWFLKLEIHWYVFCTHLSISSAGGPGKRTEKNWLRVWRTKLNQHWEKCQKKKKKGMDWQRKDNRKIICVPISERTETATGWR